MSMRITIENIEPGFSDARLAIQPKGAPKRVLRGGEKVEMIVQPNVENQIILQALRRGGEKKPG